MVCLVSQLEAISKMYIFPYTGLRISESWTQINDPTSQSNSLSWIRKSQKYPDS